MDPAAASAMVSSPTATMTAVVADDDPEIRSIITEYLVLHGCQVTQASNGLEALNSVRQVRPDLLVLDIMMPRLGGVEAMVQIRNDFPEVAVIIVTGIPDDALRGRALALGAAALLPKPLDLDLLGSIVSTVTAWSVQPAEPPGGRAPAQGAGASARTRILVVDDDDEMRSLLQDFLEGEQYDAVLACDGLEALQIVIDARPPIALLDITMPRLGGLEALTAIRAISPTTQVIMVSGIDDVELARRTLAHGAFDYVTKPINMTYLQRSIEAALGIADG